ncbi:MAG: hypothetical protein H8E84_02210 [Flavobacteriales bacterium]|nr:hypothetical protein [Flavobacteriales bacterium]
MKRYLWIFSISALLFSRTISHATNPTEWTTYYENDEITISFTYLNCEYLEQFDNEYLILRIQNNSNKDITIDWQEQLWYDNKCMNCELESPEFRKEITVKADATISGDCTTYNNLRIFSKFTEKLEDMPGVDKINTLTKFELKNLNVK